MPNITLSVDEKLLKSVRVYAKRNGTTLNALVRQKLIGLIEQERQREEARLGLIALMEASTGGLEKGYKFNRAELYESPALSGHKRAGVRRSRKTAGA